MFGIIARFQLKDIMFGCSIQHAIFDGLNICSNCPGSFFYLKDYICMYMDPDVTWNDSKQLKCKRPSFLRHAQQDLSRLSSLDHSRGSSWVSDLRRVCRCRRAAEKSIMWSWLLGVVDAWWRLWISGIAAVHGADDGDHVAHSPSLCPVSGASLRGRMYMLRCISFCSVLPAACGLAAAHEGCSMVCLQGGNAEEFNEFVLGHMVVGLSSNVAHAFHWFESNEF